MTTLTVKVNEVRGLHSRHDVYAEVRIKDHVENFKTTIQKHCTDATWNESFNLIPKNVETDEVVVKIYAHHGVTSDELLGEVELPVAVAMNPASIKEWHQLVKKTGPTSSHPVKGELKLTLQLIINGVVQGINSPPPAQLNTSMGAQQQYPPPQQQYPPPQQQYPPPQQYPPNTPPPQQYPPNTPPPQQYPPPGQQYPPNPQQFPPGQYPPSPQQFPPGQYPPSPQQQYPPGQLPPGQYPPSPQQQYPPPQQQYPPPQQQFGMGFGTPGMIQTAILEAENPFYATIAGRKAFKSLHGKYLMAEEGSLYAHHHLHEHGGKGYFQVEALGDGKICLRTHHGKFVAVDSSKNIYLTHSWHDHDCKFHLEHHNGYVAFRSSHHTYLALDPYGTVYVSHRKERDELFEVHQN